MRVFVTGGTGFVGSHLVDRLMERGDDVTCLVRDPAKAARVFRERAPHTVRGDLTDQRTLRTGCEDAEAVFHVAAVTSARSRMEFFATNSEGTRRLTAVVAEVAPHLRRFVYVSSQAASGPARRGSPRTESDPLQPVSHYGASKLAGEEAVRSSGLPWTVIRPAGVYGPRDTEFLRLFKIARIGIVPIMGDSEQELSLVHVRDLAAALVRATEPATMEKVYFACHPEIITARRFVRGVHAAVAGRRPGKQTGPIILTIPSWATRATLQVTGLAARLLGRATLLSPDKGNEFLAEAWTCSSEALERDTGWQAEISLEAGLRDTAQWYREHRWL